MRLIRGCEISTGKDNETQLVDIRIDGEKIAEIVPHKSSSLKKSANEIDATGLLAIPGAIDPHVHFDTPGYEWREDFAHGTRGAAAGGVTTVIDMPDTCVPPVTSAENLKKKLSVIQDEAYVDFALWGGVSQNVMRGEGDFDLKMNELWDEGVVGFKTYLLSGMDTFKALSLVELGQVMQKAHDIGALIGLHAEDPDIVKQRMEELKNTGRDHLTDYYIVRCDPAEKNGVAMGLGLARQTKASLHIAHLASGAAMQLIAWLKEMDVDVTAETCPHYLTFTCDDFAKYGSLIKTAPVVKTAADKTALWSGLMEGMIDFLATDHAPCPMKEKQTGSGFGDYGGMPGNQLMLPFAFSEGYLKGRLSLKRMIEVTSSNAAKRFGIYPKKGAMQVESDADITLIDPKGFWDVKGTDLESKAKWTPFEGRRFDGRVVATMVRGETVYTFEKGVVGRAGYGKWVKRTEADI